MSSSNINPIRGRRRDSGPQLQVPRRSSASRTSSGISRLAAATSGSSAAPSARTMTLSSSAPEHGDEAPLLAHRKGQKTYGTLEESSKRPRTEAASRLIRAASTSTPLPTTSSHTRSFLVPAGAAASGAKALNTMASLPKHQRTTKTSHKLVVLPSAPQTKPLAKQLVLLDEEQETSDDAAHPHGMLPPKRPQKRTSAKGRIPRSMVQEPESEETQEDPSHPSKMRIRDYKSSAERMTKEERKKEGYKRITAYCIGEGLKMKELAGFLKREHNVLPRVFDEAMYAMYHLPLLPGYGPQTNVRSSAPPAPPIPTEGSGAAFTKSILTRLEEAEEDGYQGAYFPSEQDLINLEERADPAVLAGDVNRHSDPDSRLPGLVEPGTVDEVREYDGYVTSSSLPRQAETGRVEEGTGDEFTYEYNPYPSESSSPTSTVHKPAHYEQSDLLSAAGPYYTDSGVETDDPGAQTDPGIYGRSSSPIPLTTKAKDDGSSPSDGDMTASIMTAVPIAHDFASEGATDDEAERPRFTRAATLPVVEGIAISAEEPSPLVQDELYGEDQYTRSAYERQMGYDREKESHAEKERERLVRIAYEEALEREREREREQQLDNVGEVVFFDYGVVVFFGLAEPHERDILEDIEEAGSVRRLIPEVEWEIEECHFAHDPKISYPRIYNDFFTLKSRSHLLKLSIAHALAQSTLLARYETIAQRTLSSPLTLAIPRQMASTGALQLRRHEALKLTGRLFKLRRDVNLVSNVLDVPELFWSEASLEDLYDAVRDYMEIGPRVENLNEKLGVASDFLDAIHDHLNNSAMERITWIIIWLIVVAVLVELGEIIARLVVHSTLEKERQVAAAAVRSLTSTVTTPLSKEEALRTLERIMNKKP